MNIIVGNLFYDLPNQLGTDITLLRVFHLFNFIFQLMQRFRMQNEGKNCGKRISCADRKIKRDANTFRELETFDKRRVMHYPYFYPYQNP